MPDYICVAIPSTRARLILPRLTLRYIDLAAPIEAAVEAAGSDYNCNAYVCRGYQFEDNVDRLQTYQTGDVVPFHINLVAGHRPGWAVSPLSPRGSTCSISLAHADNFE